MLRNQLWFQVKTWRWWFNSLFSLGLQCKRFSSFTYKTPPLFGRFSSSDSFCFLNYLSDSFLMGCFAQVPHRSAHKRVFVAGAQLAGAEVSRTKVTGGALGGRRELRDGVRCRRLAVMWSGFVSGRSEFSSRTRTAEVFAKLINALG